FAAGADRRRDYRPRRGGEPAARADGDPRRCRSGSGDMGGPRRASARASRRSVAPDRAPPVRGRGPGSVRRLAPRPAARPARRVRRRVSRHTVRARAGAARMTAAERIGYRDYLVGVWAAIVKPARWPGIGVEEATLLLNRRFHQDFRTTDFAQQSAPALMSRA